MSSIEVSATLDRSQPYPPDLTVSASIYIEPFYDEEFGYYYDEINWDIVLDGTVVDVGTGYSSVEIGPYLYSLSSGIHELFVGGYNTYTSESVSFYGDINNNIHASFGQMIFGYNENEFAANIDIAYGSEFDDQFSLGQNDDIADGGGGNDYIDGGSGADSMYGGLGDDIIYVDNASDKVFELNGEGSDRVFASVSYTLANEVYVETFATTLQSGSAAISLTGNSYGQTIRGNNGVNTLIGNGGNDVLDGFGGADTMRGGLGDDTFWVDNAGDQVFEVAGQGSDRVFASVNFVLAADQAVEWLATSAQSGTSSINLTGNGLGQTLNGNNGANTLLGLAGNDLLIGNQGNDTLSGGVGIDTLRGGLGNDSLYVENAGDMVQEAAGEGTDTVNSSVSYTIAATAAIEVIQTISQAGNGAINLTGNVYGQGIYGNAGANNLIGYGGGDNLKGLGGNDRLYGGVGNDLLSGGTGKDVFAFQAALSATTNVDTITDFSSIDDTIQLDDAVFKALATGTLTAGAFMANSTGLATQADDRIIYETDTGNLFYDSNGSAAGGSVLFADLAANLTLTSNDFLVV